MMRFLRRAAGSLALFLGAAFVWAAPPQLIVPLEPSDRLRQLDRPFVSEGTAVRFNKAQMLGLRHMDEVEARLPNGAAHSFVFELAEDHGGGIHSWFGRHKQLGNKHRAIITSGPHGSFGIISTPDGDFRLMPGDGEFDWLMDVTAEEPHVPLPSPENDVRISPIEMLKDLKQFTPDAYRPLEGMNSLPMTKVAPTSGNVVDIMFVITNALSTNLGANLVTRLQFLVARANASYADSDVAIRLRMVHHVVVNYTDANDNGDALGEISPLCTPGGACGPGFNATVFGTIEALRTTHGADVVALMRNGSNSGGSGIAWLGQRNAGSTAITNPTYMYSVTTGCVRGCESVFIHEVGHNFGLNHDRATDAWQDGGRPYPASGNYNYGYYYCASGGLTCNPEAAGSCTAQPECAVTAPANFADLMAYFHASTENTYKFSSPLLTCAGNATETPQSCGAANIADGARWLNEVRAALSAIRSTQGTYTDGSSSVTGWPPTASGLPAGFTSTGSAWAVATDRVFEGTHSLRSAQVYSPGPFAFPPTTFANSDLNFTGTFNSGTVSFMYEVSALSVSGTGFGVFEFSIDDITVLADTGESGWQFFSYPITAGSHTLRWRFKNGSTNPCTNPGFTPRPIVSVNCADRAWIDSVSLPLATGSGPFALTVTPAGTGAGTVTSAPAGINCGSTCTFSFTSGTPVTLTAAPAAGSTFAGWSGGVCSGTGGCTVTMSAAVTVTATFNSTANPPRLANISTRGQVLTGADVMIGGFIIGGSTPKTVVIRANGPSLTALGVPGALANPLLQLFSGQTQIAVNDNWQSAANAATIQSSGFAPLHTLESAIYTTLNPGPYTAIVSGSGGGTGVGLVEVFEVDLPNNPLINISTRGQVQTGNNVMIAGFIIQGSGPQTVVVRASGPSLTALGVPGALANPNLQLFSGQTQIASNDNWQLAANAATILSSGFAPINTLESAILITLNPGAYTAIVTGVGGGTGVGIVEVFAVP